MGLSPGVPGLSLAQQTTISPGPRPQVATDFCGDLPKKGFSKRMLQAALSCKRHRRASHVVITLGFGIVLELLLQGLEKACF